MNKPYKHITLVETTDDTARDSIRSALHHTTLVYWVGRPEPHKIDKAIIAMGKVGIIEEAAEIHAGVKVVAADLSRLTPQLRSKYILDFELLKTIVIDTKGRSRSRFLEHYDESIGARVAALEGQSNH